MPLCWVEAGDRSTRRRSGWKAGGGWLERRWEEAGKTFGTSWEEVENQLGRGWKEVGPLEGVARFVCVCCCVLVYLCVCGRDGGYFLYIFFVCFSSFCLFVCVCVYGSVRV